MLEAMLLASAFPLLVPIQEDGQDTDSHGEVIAPAEVASARWV
jgi:hypothetical protein